MTTFLSQALARQIDVELMSAEGGFVVEQLMELAGLGCAQAIVHQFGTRSKRALICCGPGNNGGDGLVAARHLRHFGWLPSIYYPRSNPKPLYAGLLKQNVNLKVPVHTTLTESLLADHDVIIDAIFGFSFQPGEIRSTYDKDLELIAASMRPIISIDVPSGWHVENGPPESGPKLSPEVLISLTAPKQCARFFKGNAHYVAGRFIPPSMVSDHNLSLPEYEGVSQFTLLRP